jgi:hypothetical protein
MATKERSPSYPILDLEQALAAVDAIYRKERRATIPWSQAAKAMGYQAVSGPVRSRIAALKQYGLIETGTAGQLRISDRAFDLVASPRSSPQYVGSLREAALEPPIFRELIPLQEASDETLVYRLQREKQFSEDGARRAVRAFRSTMAFAKLDEPSYDGGTDGDIPEEESVQEPQTIAPRGIPSTTKVGTPTVGQFSFLVPKGRAIVSFTEGVEPTKATWAALKKYIELTEQLAPENGDGLESPDE